MKTFVSLALALVLTASALVGCGCTNRNMENTSVPTVLPTNEEIWNSTETTTQHTTMTETTHGTTATETTDTTRNINETEVQNHVNDYSNMVQEQMRKDKEARESTTDSNTSRMVPGTR